MDLMYSLHGQLLKTSDEDEPDFTKALELQAERRAGIRIPLQCNCREYLQYERLATCSGDVERFIAIFGGENVKIVLLEDLACNLTETLSAIFGFLGVRQGVEVDDTPKNLREAIPNQSIRNILHRHQRMHGFLRRLIPLRLYAEAKRRSSVFQRQPDFSPRLRCSINDRFSSEINRLSGVLSRDLSHWM